MMKMEDVMSENTMDKNTIKEMNKKIKYTHLKQGINRNRKAYEDIKYNESYKRERKAARNKIYKRADGVRNLKTIPNTRSEKWKSEERKTEYSVLQTEIEMPEREIAIILIDKTPSKTVADVYKTKINPYNYDEQIVKIGKPDYKRKVEVEIIKANLENLEDKIYFQDMEIETDELIKLAMKNDVEIYEIMRII